MFDEQSMGSVMKSRVAAARPRGEVVRQFIQFTAVVAALLTPLSAAAQPTTAHIVEWDLPATVDASPGAMVVDTLGDDQNRIWFVTRTGAPQRAFRFDPAKSLMTGRAQWKSWELSDPLQQPPNATGGVKRLRPSRDRRFIFVRTSTSIVRIDTQTCAGTPQTCARTAWVDQNDNAIVSDLAVDDFNNVFTTNELVLGDPLTSYVQMLKPGAPPACGGGNKPAPLTPWAVGGGAGGCPGAGLSGPCGSGIATPPRHRNLIYYSGPLTNNNGELNT